ncbi:MAG TPA: nitrite reductase large subunit NirB [Steroidobacteraceae bacterium]|nr:nitrite reductase large subunit NirB [Steroidobacteraceae bacterium]
MKLVVIGNGMVGQRFLENVAGNRELDIEVLCEEPRLAYDRVHLSSFFSGKSAADLALTTEAFFREHGITVHVGDGAVHLDRSLRCVTSRQGRELSYEKLVLATGSYPFVPKIPGSDRPQCLVYRTIEDLEAIRSAAAVSRVGVVIGGGLLGLEAAKALQDLGLETHVVEFAPRLMAVQLDAGGGAMLRGKIEQLGVRVHTGKATAAIAPGGAHRHTLQFADGTALEADLVVFSAGIRPRDELARASGLSVGERGGVIVDGRCQTSDPDIYAIGECASFEGRCFGLVAPGYQMAGVAASQLAGQERAQFTGADLSTKLKLMGVDVASLGDAHGARPGARAYTFIDERKQLYKKLVVSEDGRNLLGGILVGGVEDYDTWLPTLQNGLPLPADPAVLVLPAAGDAAGAAPRGLGVAALPEDAQICSCNSVSKRTLCAAVAAGCTTLGAVKKSTRAASSCGGCAPLVTQLLHAELERRGVAVSRDLCEHFAHSRQELFHLVRLGGIRSFDALIARHGKGRGCDICKPAVASILASCWNEFVLEKGHAALQDTNDYFLANMQKDGTYSVIPRVPGGEITPQKLIALGEVAQKYGLYTKITGGQRIDLLGAQVHQLPLIWRELIAAGFESGHAYGKALRTVKSCVGSTWCRYGVQDSVGLAIELEHRYKGLRAPHKIKLGVSGCTRECAEAQSKDVGIIATEKGWGLYVCGNGGMKPRHASLLASDLDRETLIRTIDRFLMFYIRTADRLQRTATWLDHLEGGLDYLREVVCDDRLGIGAELEADMARVVQSYADEWAAAVNDPATLRRFRHFINSEDTDSNVVFVEERGQRRPATAAERRRRSAGLVGEPG